MLLDGLYSKMSQTLAGAAEHRPRNTIHESVRKCTSYTLYANNMQARLQPIIVSRFLLNLRQADYPESSIQTSRFGQFSMPMNFRVPTLQSIVGNMGEPLEHGDREDMDEDEGAVVDTDVPKLDDLDTMSGEGTGAGPSGMHQWEDGGIQEVRRYRPRLQLELSSSFEGST